VSLDGSTIAVQSGGEAQVKLACVGGGTCMGKLLLTVKGVARKGKKSKAQTIATGSFSVAAGRAATIKLKLSAVGRALLGASHGRLGATLALLKSFPVPSQTHTEIVEGVRLTV
jgi:hypothetical protein